MATEKLLIATANNSRKYLEQLKAEVEAIRDVALADAHTKTLIDVTDRTGINYGLLWDDLNRVTAPAITMLHYIGHSSEKGFLLENSTSQQSFLSPEAIAKLINKETSQLRLVFLNSCYSQEIAEKLRDAGVPYVIGTVYTVPDSQAVEVAKQFYTLLGNYSITIEEAFEQTQLHFNNNLDKPNPIAQPTRDGFSTTIDDSPGSPVAPWQIYPRNDLTDEQRNWRLIPPPKPYVVKPTEFNECYVVTPISTVSRPFSFFLSYMAEDQPFANELAEQIRLAFQWVGSVEKVWSDDTTTDIARREQELTNHLQQTDFVFLFVRDTYLVNPVAKQVIKLISDRKASGSLILSPLVFPTARCAWQNSAAGGFSHFLLTGQLISTDLLAAFANKFYQQWKNEWQRKQLRLSAG